MGVAKRGVAELGSSGSIYDDLRRVRSRGGFVRSTSDDLLGTMALIGADEDRARKVLSDYAASTLNKVIHGGTPFDGAVLAAQSLRQLLVEERAGRANAQRVRNDIGRPASRNAEYLRKEEDRLLKFIAREFHKYAEDFHPRESGPDAREPIEALASLAGAARRISAAHFDLMADVRANMPVRNQRQDTPATFHIPVSYLLWAIGRYATVARQADEFIGSLWLRTLRPHRDNIYTDGLSVNGVTRLDINLLGSMVSPDEAATKLDVSEAAYQWLIATPAGATAFPEFVDAFYRILEMFARGILTYEEMTSWTGIDSAYALTFLHQAIQANEPPSFAISWTYLSESGIMERVTREILYGTKK